MGIKVYVLAGADGKINRYSTIQGTGIEVIQDDPVIDMSKLVGYEIVIGDDGQKHFIFNEEKWNAHVAEEEHKIAFEQANNDLKQQALAALSDEDAMKFQILFPEFQPGVEYNEGDRVVYNGRFYKVVQGHLSQEDWNPEAAASIFARIGNPAEEFPEFIQPTGAHDAYAAGDKVTFEGAKYESLMDANIYSPAAYPAGWQVIE